MASVVERLIATMGLDARPFFAQTKRASKRFGRFEKETKRRAKRINNVFRGLAGGIGGGLAVRSIVRHAKAWGQYDKALSLVQAKSGAARGEIDSLSKTLAGNAKETIHSLSQVGEAAVFIAQKGFDPQQIEKMIRPVLDTATAAGAGIQDTADIFTNIAQAIEIPFEELPRLADILVQVTAKSGANLLDLGESMKYAAGAGRALGMEISDTGALLGHLANVGIKGSLGGTAIRQSLVALTKGVESVGEAGEETEQSLSKQGDALRRLGVQIRDDRGQFRNLVDILREMNLAGATASDWVNIFGARAGTSFLQAFQGGGLAKFEDLLAKVNDSQGQAQEQAATSADNLSGSFDILRSKAENLRNAFFESGGGEGMDVIIGKIGGAMDAAVPAAEAFGRQIGRLGLAIEKNSLETWDNFLTAGGQIQWQDMMAGLSGVPMTQFLPPPKKPPDYSGVETAFAKDLTPPVPVEGATGGEDGESPESVLHTPLGETLLGETGANVFEELAAGADKAFGGIAARAEKTAETIALTMAKVKDGGESNWSALAKSGGAAFSFILTEGSKHSKKLASIQKKIAIANVVINTADSIMTAFASVPFPASLAVAGMYAAMGATQLATIRAQEISGAAHGGMDSVPKDSTFLLKRGERVIQPEQNRDLSRFLAMQKTQDRRSGDMNIRINAVDGGSVDDLLRRRKGLLRGLNQQSRFENAGAM